MSSMIVYNKQVNNFKENFNNPHENDNHMLKTLRDTAKSSLLNNVKKMYISYSNKYKSEKNKPFRTIT